MAGVKNTITLGIGANPGKPLWFVTSGLGTAPLVGTEITLSTRSANLTLAERDLAWSLFGRSVALTVEDRAQ